MINVTKTYLPPFEEYMAILKRAWDKAWITNNGELVLELEKNLKDYLSLNNLFYCTNGTIVLQMALKALNITKEVITTPFSYVATVNALLWEGCTPVFVDVDRETLCIDANKIENAITPNTQAILATHVYGIPCDVEKIEAIAAKHNLKVIYDGAHAFGCTYKGRALLSYGDISTCSFHATKLFHTVEGGCIIFNDELAQKLLLYRSFGHIGDDYYSIGINGKNSEFHAAMGLAILPKMSEILQERKRLFSVYASLLPAELKRPAFELPDFEYNYSYLPVIFETEKCLLKVKEALAKKQINTRRYFYPSLNKLPQTLPHKVNCQIAEEISTKVLCLPVFPGLEDKDIELITTTLKEMLS
ncbi:DegT/DnrJ/EryC1/StrS family aminotransferase [Niastella caeni]|uniref:DegT/DnrJ/EryC1/StrS family aminotransferase n=1 Tax=Niastella caeni TaxID=2569763 RepID=A0A4S8I4I4_9BACT|nr:DegT/DnrJ/EryC1/StrS family aminotransferase [Niastella caeni]THU41542.1 DegT/DnrJ/EryC1/StrS family aminotransferase [Niastella caeni]